MSKSIPHKRYARLEYMNPILRFLIPILFPSQYTKNTLSLVPKAPEPDHKNIFALYDYHSDSGKKLIYAIKKSNDLWLSHLVAKEMSLHLKEYLSDQSLFSFYLEPLIVPVPLTQKSLKKRGFNQIDFTSRYLSKELNATYSPLIIKEKETKKQALLKNKKDRFDNVRSCFHIQKGKENFFKNKDVIIVDDLITTGATIQEIEKVLLRNGARNVIAITIAH